MSARPSVVLPEPDLADDPERLPGSERQVDAIDGLHVIDDLAHETGLDREPDLDVVAFHDNRLGGVGHRRLAARFGGEQMARVVVLRIGEDLFHRSGLDDLALGHDADTVGEFAHDAEVVGDEEHGHAVLALQLAQEFEDLRLDRDVERGGRLVGDQQFGPIGERHGDHHTLTLAAREFMRIGFQPFFRLADADLVQQLQHAGTRRLPGHTLMQCEDFGNLLFDRMERIERCHRLLEDHGDVVAANFAQFAVGGLQQILALEEDLAARMACRGIGQKPQDRICRDRLAGTGFADERDNLALVDIERDAIDGKRGFATLMEGDREIADGEQRFTHWNVFLGSKASRTASPMKISSDSMIDMVKKAVSPSHGA